MAKNNTGESENLMAFEAILIYEAGELLEATGLIECLDGIEIMSPDRPNTVYSDIYLGRAASGENLTDYDHLSVHLVAEDNNDRGGSILCALDCWDDEEEDRVRDVIREAALNVKNSDCDFSTIWVI